MAHAFAVDTSDAIPPPAASRWCGGLGALTDVEGMRFARGFLDRLVITRVLPSEQWDTVVHDPHWSTVQALKFHPNAGHELAARILREAPLSSLQDVVLTRECLLQLEPCPALARVTSLGVMSGLDADVVEALEALDLPRLRRLEIWAEPWSETGVIEEDGSEELAFIDGTVGDLPILRCGALWSGGDVPHVGHDVRRAGGGAAPVDRRRRGGPGPRGLAFVPAGVPDLIAGPFNGARPGVKYADDPECERDADRRADDSTGHRG